MTKKERILAALNHKPCDKIPFALGFGLNRPVIEDLAKYLNVEVAAIHKAMMCATDIADVYSRYIGPSERRKKCSDGSEIDEWGITRIPVSYGSGHYMEFQHHPLANVSDFRALEDYTWPNPDWFDYTAVCKKIEALQKEDDYAFRVGIPNIFEHAWYLRGFETMLADLICEPEIAHAIMTKVTDYHIEYYKRLLDTAKGGVDIVFSGGDIAGQNGLLVSLPLWESMIKPHYVRLNRVLHSYDVKVMYHSCGATQEVIPGLIDAGVDILEALQFDALGMEPSLVKTLAGDQLCLHGGVSVQATLPFGTPADVEREVHHLIDVLGEGGGYILAPAHAIQAGTPPENVLAMFHAAGRQDAF